MTRKKWAILISFLFIVGSIILTISKGNLSNITSVSELGITLGFITIIPTVLAVTLAFITNNVIVSLLIGFLSGVILLAITSSATYTNVPIELITQGWTSISDVVFDIDNIKILALCIVVGGMIEVVRHSGGFEALAIKLSKKINSPRKAQLITSLLGCVIFFDDYANALVVGPTMKPVTDRVGVSREKLAYIVDSTAAPVTGIAVISSWVAVEIAAIQRGFDILGIEGNGFYTFLESIPFMFYCLFCLTFIFLNGLTGRDFGPMLKAEIKACKSKSENYKDVITTDSKLANRKVFIGVGSIVILVMFSIISFYFTGKSAAIADGILSSSSAFTLGNIAVALSYADTVSLISLGAIISSIFAIALGSINKLFSIKDALKHWLIGAKNLLGTVLLLVLAWCLADTMSRLGTTYYAIEFITGNINSLLVPLLLFLVCCVISFASGSYGCLFVVMPMTVPLAYSLINLGTVNISADLYLALCVASVMAGSIFGDHCSPVTDCTILSAQGAGCSTMDHCKTQLPYAFVVAIVSCISILLASSGINIWIVLPIGILLQLLVLFAIGKKAHI